MSTRGALVGGAGSIGPQAVAYDDQLSPAPGASLWYTCPMQAYGNDASVGSQLFDDFIGFVTGSTAWVTTQATSGTATAGNLAGGTAALNSGATTQHQGIQMQRAGGHIIPAVNKHIWFECRLKTNILQGEFLFGLFDIDTTLVAAGALHATDGIGIKSVTSDGVCLPVVGSSSTYTTGSSIKTLVAATYVRLGFVVTSNTSVQFYVDGVATGNAITTNIPTVSLTPSFVAQAGAGAGSNVAVDLDYTWSFQLR